MAASMINYPKTLGEAEAHRYDVWSGNPSGYAFDPARCAGGVYHRFGFGHTLQCERPPGRGPGGLYCKGHAKKIAEEVLDQIAKPPTGAIDGPRRRR